MPTETDNETKIATLTKASKRVLEHVASYTFPGGAPTNCVIIGQHLRLKPETVRKYVDMLCGTGLLAVRCTGLAAQGGGHVGDTMTFTVNGVSSVLMSQSTLYSKATQSAVEIMG